MAIELRYVEDGGELDALEPLWNALQEHHVVVTPELDQQTPGRELGEAWRVRRSKYARWIEEPETFIVLAEEGGAPVGYAFVTVGPPYASWDSGKAVAVLETLSVLPQHRGRGIGTDLIEAAWSRLAERGVESMAITTTKTNAGARRFYEREGFHPAFVVYHGRRGA
jgi:GNAT superfamily N-acetyltransferase